MDIKEIESKIHGELKEFANKFSYCFSSSENSLSQASGKLYKKDSAVTFTYSYGIVDKKSGGGYPSIFFHDVEEITLPILIKYGLIGEGALKEPITFVPPFAESSKEIKFSLETDLESFLEYFKSNFKKVALPTFEKYDCIQKVSEFLETVPQKEVINFIPKGIYKKATIWKLSGNPKYDEYINWLHTGMSKRANKTPENMDYKNSYNAVSELKSVLDKL